MGTLSLKKGSVTSGGLTKTDTPTSIREEKPTIHCQCGAAHGGPHTRNKPPPPPSPLSLTARKTHKGQAGNPGNREMSRPVKHQAGKWPGNPMYPFLPSVSCRYYVSTTVTSLFSPCARHCPPWEWVLGQGRRLGRRPRDFKCATALDEQRCPKRGPGPRPLGERANRPGKCAATARRDVPWDTDCETARPADRLFTDCEEKPQNSHGGLARIWIWTIDIDENFKEAPAWRGV